MKIPFYVVILAALGCTGAREQSPADSHLASRQMVLDSAVFETYQLASRQSVKEFYSGRDYMFFWLTDSGTTVQGDSMLHLIARSEQMGLIPSDYHHDELKQLLRDTLAVERLALIEVYLTDAYLTLFQHLRNGRLDPETLQRRDLSSVSSPDAVAALGNAATGSISKQLLAREPVSSQYHSLKTSLRSSGLPGDADSAARARQEKISINMERWRWQGTWPDRYVLVNIPAFMLKVVEDDSLWVESKVIVGKRETPTPVLESVIRSFIIYPYWHAPYSIATKEILPALQKDATYLRRNNFEVLSKNGSVIKHDTIRWERYSATKFPFILRQREGSENSMGIIKFNFANKFGVFLHDTNSKRLYERARRDFSHGCVRVSRAVALAHYLVREDDIYVSPEDLDQYLSLQQRYTIELRKPIALKLEYFTAEVQDGVAVFYEDIYKKDSVMMQSLYPVNPTHTPADLQPSL